MDNLAKTTSSGPGKWAGFPPLVALLAFSLLCSPSVHAHGNSDLDIEGDDDHADSSAAPAAASSSSSPSLRRDSSAAGTHVTGGEEAIEAPEVTVHGHRPVTASNSQTIRDRDLSLRMMTDPSDIVKVTPGLFTGQHAGGGKANQYFIRGFDADHGTDLALWFDGMPVNNVSHGHGQGFADLHFIIPELVDQVQVNKGTFDIEYGDLATAGSVSMRTRNSVKENVVSATGGMYNTTRMLTILSPKGPNRPLLAAEVYRSDGPFKNPEDMERYNLFLKTPVLQSSASRLDFTLMAYGAGWNGSGQIPQRAIDDGQLNRFGSLDPSEGGSSQRYSASMNYVSFPNAMEGWEASAYLIDYRLSLFSDFTFFANDSVDGDEINQRDDRLIAGLNASYHRSHMLGSLPAAALFGIATRNDIIHNNLDHAKDRRIIGKKVDADVREGSLSAFFQESIAPFPWLYLEAGIRGDHFGFDVVDRLNDTGAASITGVKDASMFSPKANIVVTPVKGTDIFLNYGEGFHSNDARGVTSPVDPARPLTKAREYEAGARTRLLDRLDLAASVWLVDMDGEFVWVGDDGVTEEGESTQRKGIDFETRLQILPWMWADFDMTKCTAEFVHDAGNGKAVALAPRLTMAGGLSMRHPSGAYGSIRAQSLDTRPADEAGDFEAKGATVVDLSLGYRYHRWEVFSYVGNLFNTEWYTAQFENDSRIKDANGVLEPETVTDMHVVPGAGVNIKGGVKFYF
ncbi:MAG: TonB-dependent receptor [Fibrobacteria bacterium]